MSPDFRNGLLTGLVIAMLAIWWIGAFGKIFAGEMWLTVPIASYHFDRQRENGKGSYEQTNPGLGLEYAINDKWRLGAGVYRSSIRTDAGYVGAGYFPWRVWSIQLGSSVGVVSGYEGNLIPLVVPTAILEGKHFGLNVLVVPPYDGKTAGLGFQIKFRLP